MREYFELAEFLAAAWRLAIGDGDARLPTSHGVLDQALFDLRDDLPEKLRNVLSFGNTRIGFRCYELPEILYCAQANLLTSEPNPTYLTTSVQIGQDTARQMLRRRKIGPEFGKRFGLKLIEAIDVAKAKVKNTVTEAA